MKINSSTAIVLGTILSFLMLFYSCKEKKEPLKPIRYIGSYNRDFNDLNDAHLKSAKVIGIDPISGREEAKKMKKKLKEIRNTDNYTIEELTHSIPFLVPKAADLLTQIGVNFSDSLNHLNAPHYKLRVTSITRTKDDISSLRKRNVNSTENSAHMYATTVDISWVRYEKDSRDKQDLTPEQLKMVLASVLRDLKKDKRCYVKHEKKQGCFHITAR